MDLSKREQLFKSGYYNLDRNENLDKIYLGNLHLKNINAYPDYPAFINRMAEFYDVKPEEILPTAGCTEAIKVVCDYFIQSGTDILVLRPTYEGALNYILTLNAHVHSLPHNTPMDDIVRYINENNIRFFYLCNPNNPTGTVFSLEDLRKLTTCKASVFIDESYYEFCEVTAVSLITSDNIMVGRSFSKAWGLAGLRAGMLISNSKLIHDLTPYKVKASLNVVAVEMITNLSNNYTLVLDSVKRIKEGNRFLRNMLTVYNNYKIYNEPTVNFIVSDMPSEKLDELKILHKTVGPYTCFTVVPVEEALDIFRFRGLPASQLVLSSSLVQ